MNDFIVLHVLSGRAISFVMLRVCNYFGTKLTYGDSCIQLPVASNLTIPRVKSINLLLCRISGLLLLFGRGIQREFFKEQPICQRRKCKPCQEVRCKNELPSIVNFTPSPAHAIALSLIVAACSLVLMSRSNRDGVFLKLFAKITINAIPLKFQPKQPFNNHDIFENFLHQFSEK